jgi:hypothetical protein
MWTDVSEWMRLFKGVSRKGETAHDGSYFCGTDMWKEAGIIP